MPTLESSFHLHEKTGCRFSYEWWLNPRYPSKPNKSCIRYSMFCIFYLSFQPPTRSVSIIFRAQHDASWKHFEGSPQFSYRPNSPKGINNSSSNSLSSNHSLKSLQTAFIPLTTHSTNPTPTATANSHQPPHHNNHHNCSSAWVGAFTNSFYHGTTKVWTCDDGKAHLETWLSWQKAGSCWEERESGICTRPGAFLHWELENNHD